MHVRGDEEFRRVLRLFCATLLTHYMRRTVYTTRVPFSITLRNESTETLAKRPARAYGSVFAHALTLSSDSPSASRNEPTCVTEANAEMTGVRKRPSSAFLRAIRWGKGVPYRSKLVGILEERPNDAFFHRSLPPRKMVGTGFGSEIAGIWAVDGVDAVHLTGKWRARRLERFG
mmetsp:Transcript_348/g.1027  ORF Transcript_348/g.1027 Transcript_348/m.1027 type:complete len:174 (+) Transcript_348:980-1501(+)